jgi:hypothetical protein
LGDLIKDQPMLIVTFIFKEFKYKFYSMYHRVKMTTYWRFSCTISQSEPEYNNIKAFYTVLFYENFAPERLRCLTVTKISLRICCTFWDQLLSLGSGEGSRDSNPELLSTSLSSEYGNTSRWGVVGYNTESLTVDSSG